MHDRRQKDIERAAKMKTDRDLKKQEEEKRNKKTLYENRKKKPIPESTKANQSQTISFRDADEESKRNDTPRKVTGIGMGVKKMQARDVMKDANDLELNTDIDNNDGFTDFTTDFYQSAASSARTSIMTTTTNADMADIDSNLGDLKKSNTKK